MKTLHQRPGHPSKRTPARRKTILEAVAKGMPYSHAVKLAGISLQCFAEWRAGDAGFVADLDEAVAKGILVRLDVIGEASAGDWRASAWLLEHCNPELFAKNRLEVCGADGAPLTAGIRIYLPRKETVVECERLALPERTQNGNGH